MRVFQVTYCEDKYEQKVAAELLKLYERLREDHTEFRFDFMQAGKPMGVREES